MTSLKTTVIAIDGPAASGKTSVGKIIAEKLNFNFLDTGIMYRAITYAALDSNVVFNKKTLDERMPTFEIQSSEIEKSNFSILDAIEKLNLSNSRSDTKRLIKSKGIKINDEIYNSGSFSLEYYLNLTNIKISVGKKNIGIIKIKN